MSNSTIATLPLRTLRISDHALARYLERKHLLRAATVDLDQARAAILPTDPQMLAAIDSLGDGEYGVGTSHRIRIADRVVVTVLPYKDDRPPSKIKPAHYSNRKTRAH